MALLDYVSSYKPNTNTVSPSTGVDYGSNNSAKNNANYGNAWFDQLKAISDANNAFNLSQVEMVNSFNAHEAQKNRDWQERMSNTAHQREVKDLLEAGLNPILSAMNGQGAYTGSGAVASGQKAVADNVLGNGVISLMNSMIGAASAQSVANTYAAAQMYSADVQMKKQVSYNDVWKTITGMNNSTSSANNERSNQYNLLNGLLRLVPAALTMKGLEKTPLSTRNR